MKCSVNRFGGLAYWARGLVLGTLGLGVAGCADVSVSDGAAHTASTAPMSPAQRIVSLDYCADQYLLKFADRDRIVAVSIDAQKPFSYMRKQAAGLAQVRSRAADVLAQKPDLVIRSYGGGAKMTGFLEQAGVPVLQLGFPSTLDEMRAEIVRVAEGLGNHEAGVQLVAQMDQRLAAIAAAQSANSQSSTDPIDRPAALYLTPSGVVSGEGSLVHEALVAAGFRNFQDRAGWNPIPLERLVYESPDLIALGFAQNNRDQIDPWSAARHPIAQARLRDRPVVPIQGAWTACGGWFLVDAIEALAASRAEQGGMP